MYVVMYMREHNIAIQIVFSVAGPSGSKIFQWEVSAHAEVDH